MLTRSSDRTPDKHALTYQTRTLTYGGLDAITNQTARGFLQDGLVKGDMVAMLSKNNLDFVIVQFSLAKIGAVMIPINYMLSPEDFHYILAHAEANVLIASEAYTPILDQAADRLHIKQRYKIDSPSPNDKKSASWKPLTDVYKNMTSAPIETELHDDELAQVLYTSGTESRPKGVMLSHRNLISEFVSCIVDGKMEADDIAIHALPLFHSAQLNVFLGPAIYLGASGIILESADPGIILETVEREGVSQLFCPPTVWISLLRHPDFDKRDLSTLKKCYYGAAIMPREILKELTERLPQAKFWNFYGQTEVAPLATALQPEDQLRKLGSAGKPALNVQTKIVDDNDVEVPRGEIGEIVHRTPHAMKGYLHDPDKTAEAFRNGWFHSGDLGVMDAEGYITVVDRKKDMIITGGENVSSREVEEVIYQIPGVSEVAVISIPDPYWVEAVTAIIVLKDGEVLEAQEVKEFCKEHLSNFKVPKNIVFTNNMPKNPSGKILKRTLRDRYERVGDK